MTTTPKTCKPNAHDFQPRFKYQVTPPITAAMGAVVTLENCTIAGVDRANPYIGEVCGKCGATKKGLAG